MSSDVLVTPRFLLRPAEPDDAPFLVRLNADPECVRHTGDVAFADVAEALAIVAYLQGQWRERRLGRLIVVTRDAGEPLGWCGLKWHEPEQAVDLGFRLVRSAWGRGVATEAGRACLDEADRRGLVVFAGVRPANVASVRVLEKLGFHGTGRIDGEGFERYVRADPVATPPG